MALLLYHSYIVEEINALGGDIKNAYGIDVNQLIEVRTLWD